MEGPLKAKLPDCVVPFLFRVYLPERVTKSGSSLVSTNLEFQATSAIKRFQHSGDLLRYTNTIDRAQSLVTAAMSAGMTQP